MNSNDIVNASFGDKKAWQKVYKETEKIISDQKRIEKITDEITNIMKGLKV